MPSVQIKDVPESTHGVLRQRAAAGRSRCRTQSPPFRPTVLVVDASVLAVAIADDSNDGGAVRARLRDETLAAPESVDLEVVSVLRSQNHTGV